MRHEIPRGRPVVVKVGSSSLTSGSGGIDPVRLGNVVDQVAAAWDGGHPTVLVTSGAIAAGVPVLGLDHRPTDLPGLQVAAAVGQSHLMHAYAEAFAARGRTVGQVLLTRDVLATREQYVHSSSALERMLDLGVVPIVNENDVIIVDEVRFGDNDRLAAMVSHLVGAALLVLLTDIDGIYDGDPRVDAGASLISRVQHSDPVLDRVAEVSKGGAFGSGGIATKVSAARMAAWSAIPTVVAAATEPAVVARAIAGDEVGTWVAPRHSGLPARKLWIAFGLSPAGSVTIDAGAVSALVVGGRSLLSVGVTGVDGVFDVNDSVEVRDTEGMVVARGRVRMTSDDARATAGRRVDDGVVVHRDDLVVMVDV